MCISFRDNCRLQLPKQFEDPPSSRERNRDPLLDMLMFWTPIKYALMLKGPDNKNNDFLVGWYVML